MMDAMEKALNSSRLRTEPSFILLYWKVVKHRLYAVSYTHLTLPTNSLV